MTRFATRLLSLPLLLMIALSVRLQAQRMVLSKLPAPPDAKEALFGSISPDGRSFVYEVVEGEERLLWRVDLGSLRSERLTPSPGVRSRAVWAPDGKRLAYWRSHPLSRSSDGSEGVYVLDVDSRTERLLVRPTLDSEDAGGTSTRHAYDVAGMSGDVTWLSDGRILYWKMLAPPSLNGFGRFVLASVIAKQSHPSTPPSSISGGDENSISRSGRREANIAYCCGGALRAIQVRDANGTHCVAGPIASSMQGGRAIAWTKDEKRLYVVARAPDGADTLEHAFAVDLTSGDAWRIGPGNRAITSVSITDGGDVALTLNADSGRIGSLWILPASSVRSPDRNAQHLQHCPPMAKRITDLVRRSNLPRVHWIAPEYEDSTHQLTLFSVTYGDARDIYPTRPGMRYGSRVGWLVEDDPPHELISDSGRRSNLLFSLRSTDTYLFSDSLLVRMEQKPLAAELWRFFLIRNPATPFNVIIREVRRNPHRLALMALLNPSVTSSNSIPFSDRLELAALEDTLAAALVTLPGVRNDPEKLASIADLPMYRSGQGLAAWRVEQQLRRLLPSLVANMQSLSERAALHVYMTEERLVVADSLRLTLLHSVSPSRNRAILALAAVPAWDRHGGDVEFARTALSRLGTSPERELLHAVERVRSGELPGDLPQYMLSDYVRVPWPVMAAISRLDERFSIARAHAAVKLADDPSTPDSLLNVLSVGLAHVGDPLLAERLLGRRPFADTSRTLLRVVAHLENLMYGKVAKQAREKLAKLDASDTASMTAPLAPSAGGQQPHQCRAADDWSEQLRDAIAGAHLLVLDSLCAQAVVALQRGFDIPEVPDSVYLFGVADGFVSAFPPVRPSADVTLVRFDSTFAERSRQVVRVH